MVDEAWNETLAYIRQKAPPDSNRKSVLTGQKQQQYITQFINQNQVPSPPQSDNKGPEVIKNKGWGKVG